MSAFILVVLIVLAGGLYYASKNESLVRGVKPTAPKATASPHTPAAAAAPPPPRPVPVTPVVSEEPTASTAEQLDRQFEQRAS